MGPFGPQRFVLLQFTNLVILHQSSESPLILDYLIQLLLDLLDLLDLSEKERRNQALRWSSR